MESEGKTAIKDSSKLFGLNTLKDVDAVNWYSESSDKMVWEKGLFSWC